MLLQPEEQSDHPGERRPSLYVYPSLPPLHGNLERKMHKYQQKIETSANLGINRIYFVLISPPKFSLYLLTVGDEVMAQEIVF